MKLRINANSIRLRLSKTDVVKLATDGYLEERVSFADKVFSYSLRCKAGIHKLSANFKAGKINVFVPKALIKDWADNDAVGFDTYMPVGENDSLYILVEKDFKCIEKTGEDQSDNYENPNKITET